MLSLLMLIACFAACGNGDETTLPTANGGEDEESGRNAVKDSIPADLKFNGEKVTFFVRNQDDLLKNEMDVDSTTNDTLFDAIYYRNTTVEDRLGVEITTVGQTGGSGSIATAWNSTLRNAVLTKSGDFDAAAIYASQSSVLAVEGLYFNVLDLPHIDFNKPWWNKGMHDELTLFDTLYFLGGDVAITQITRGYCMFYNKGLLTEFYKAQNINLYDVVDQGKWTIDYMGELVSNVWVDENSDGIISDGDTVGFLGNPSGSDGQMDAWVPSMGINITTMVDGYPELTFYNEHTVEAFEKVKNLYLNNTGTLSGTGFEQTKFAAGNQLFGRAQLNSGSTYRDMTDDYGVLPMPKFDEEQDDYHTTFHNSASLVVVLSTCQETEKVGATLELIAAEGYKQVTPAYFEVCLQGKYSDSPEDAAMYDRIIKSMSYNFGFCYSTKSLEGVGSLFRNLTVDLAQTYEANKLKYETALETLIDKLDEISYVAK